MTDTTLFDCPKCVLTITLDLSQAQKVLLHMGVHILHDQTLEHGVEHCGLCLQRSPACHFMLRKGKGSKRGPAVDQKSLECVAKTNFQYSMAAQSSPSSPCSNVPVPCPIPGYPQVVWKYYLKVHIVKAHPSASVDNYTEVWSLTTLEKRMMKEAWINRLKVPTKRAKKADAPLIPSDAHRSIIRTTAQPAPLDTIPNPTDPSDETSDTGSPVTQRKASLVLDREDPTSHSLTPTPSYPLPTSLAVESDDSRVAGEPAESPHSVPLDDSGATLGNTPADDVADGGIDVPTISGAADGPAGGIAVPGAVGTEVGGEVEVTELGRGRRHKRVVVSALQTCTCGLTVDDNDTDRIRCCRAGCETVNVRDLFSQ